MHIYISATSTANVTQNCRILGYAAVYQAALKKYKVLFTDDNDIGNLTTIYGIYVMCELSVGITSGRQMNK